MPMRSAIGLDDLRNFYLIAEAGGVSAAQRQFGISKATLSRALSRLEERARGHLFDRVSTGLRLTAAGETLLDVARRATQAGSQADELLRAVTEQPRGTLRVAASALSGQYLLGPVVARLTAEFPKVKAHIEVAGSGPDPLTEDLDVVLRLGRPEEPYLIAKRIVSTPMRLYCGTEFARSNPVDDLSEIVHLPRVCIDVPGVPRDWVLSDDSDSTKLVFDTPPQISVGDPTVALGMIASGAGIAMLPARFGDEQVRGGGVVSILPEFSMGNIEIFAVFPPRRSSIPSVRLLIDYLVEHAQQM
ncbi:LysR family transcriptional regulator [Cognatiyoonia sp. IB215182]|uniref:LysR family transcriptional regulator n=1 Tax=Cognatiyoonia sp. IB215182 TaxID=3097353 RepID=UPI002A11E650|nr:LysR family transcriptional regulator [Cognatiyoonia sp. IB215182]MDX8351810.1 LysR family transcriptional regulator [Cognatiyoonia sp. IB215182]